MWHFAPDLGIAGHHSEMRIPMAKPGLPARIAAADILHAVIKDEMPLSEVREQAATVLSDLRPEERARAFSIAQIVLRNLLCT